MIQVHVSWNCWYGKETVFQESKQKFETVSDLFCFQWCYLNNICTSLNSNIRARNSFEYCKVIEDSIVFGLLWLEFDHTAWADLETRTCYESPLGPYRFLMQFPHFVDRAEFDQAELSQITNRVTPHCFDIFSDGLLQQQTIATGKCKTNQEDRATSLGNSDQYESRWSATDVCLNCGFLKIWACIERNY